MIEVLQQFGELGRSNMEATQRYALSALDGVDQVLRLQADAFKELRADGGLRLLEMWSGNSSSMREIEWSQMFEENMDRTEEMGHICLDVLALFQNGLADIIRQQLPNLNQGFAENMNMFNSKSNGSGKLLVNGRRRRA